MMKPKTRIKRVLLINPPWYRLFGASLASSPLGLCYLAAILEKHGYDVSIYNADYKFGIDYVSSVKLTTKYNEYLRILRDMNHPLWKEADSVIRQQSLDFLWISVLAPKYG